VPYFADVAKALAQLTKNDKIWDWNQECQESFDKLKSKLNNTPVLAFPDFKVPVILRTDAPTIGLYAVLSQVQEGTERPISFASRQLNPLTPNDHYSGRTAPLTSKRCILYIYSTNIFTEYFKHGIFSRFFLKMQFVL
jgi:hypothetical protein